VRGRGHSLSRDWLRTCFEHSLGYKGMSGRRNSYLHSYLHVHVDKWHRSARIGRYGELDRDHVFAQTT